MCQPVVAQKGSQTKMVFVQKPTMQEVAKNISRKAKRKQNRLVEVTTTTFEILYMLQVHPEGWLQSRAGTFEVIGIFYAVVFQ